MNSSAGMKPDEPETSAVEEARLDVDLVTEVHRLNAEQGSGEVMRHSRDGYGAFAPTERGRGFLVATSRSMRQRAHR